MPVVQIPVGGERQIAARANLDARDDFESAITATTKRRRNGIGGAQERERIAIEQVASDRSDAGIVDDAVCIVVDLNAFEPVLARTDDTARQRDQIVAGVGVEERGDGAARHAHGDFAGACWFRSNGASRNVDERGSFEVYTPFRGRQEHVPPASTRFSSTCQQRSANPDIVTGR